MRDFGPYGISTSGFMRAPSSDAVSITVIRSLVFPDERIVTYNSDFFVINIAQFLELTSLAPICSMHKPPAAGILKAQCGFVLDKLVGDLLLLGSTLFDPFRQSSVEFLQLYRAAE